MSISETTAAAFAERFGRPPTVVGEAPGRLELLGNHTDYNEGLVLSCAIDRTTCFAAAPATGDESLIHSEAMGGDCRFPAGDVGDPVPGHWANYVKGVVAELAKRGVQLPAFDGLVQSTVPLSAGMSSSAAIEMASAYAFGQLAAAEFSLTEWAKIGQGSENNYVGAMTGLLDQFTAVHAKAGHVVHSDFRSLEVQTLPGPEGAVLVVADSGVKHDLTHEYNERRESCEAAAKVLGELHPDVAALRDVSMVQLEAARDQLDVVCYRRAKHIVGENERVRQGLIALQAHDLDTFGWLMSESHQSSRDCFENSCPELDILVATGKSLDGCAGSRLSGGGFGGISIHLVAEGEAERFRERLRTAFETRLGHPCETMICAIGEGARIHV